MADFIRSMPSASSEPARAGRAARPYRLFVEGDMEGDLTRIRDASATSDSETGRPLDGAPGPDEDALSLTPTEVRWLHGVLGELITEWDRNGV